MPARAFGAASWALLLSSSQQADSEAEESKRATRTQEEISAEDVYACMKGDGFRACLQGTKGPAVQESTLTALLDILRALTVRGVVREAWMCVKDGVRTSLSATRWALRAAALRCVLACGDEVEEDVLVQGMGLSEDGHAAVRRLAGECAFLCLRRAGLRVGRDGDDFDVVGVCAAAWGRAAPLIYDNAERVSIPLLCGGLAGISVCVFVLVKNCSKLCLPAKHISSCLPACFEICCL